MDFADGLPQLSELAEKIMNCLEQASTIGEACYAVGGPVSYQRFTPRMAKPLFDEADYFLANYYRLTDEELDFIINYDIKYRMGIDNS